MRQNSLKKYTLSLFLVLLASIFSGACFASDFRTSSIGVNKKVDAPGLSGSFGKLAKSDEGSFLFHAVGAYMGVNPGVTEAIRASAENFSQQGSGTTRWNVFFKEPGYVFCNAEYRETSGTGRRKMALSAREDRLDIEIWVHEQGGFFPGGNWTQGNINVALVKADKYSYYRGKNKCVGYGPNFRTGGM